MIDSADLTISGSVHANGGQGSDPAETGSGGGGAGGRVKILQVPTNIDGSNIKADGGAGCGGWGNGGSGSIYWPGLPASTPPTGLGLLADDDTGRSNSDLLTKVAQPRITGAAPNNSIIRIYDGVSQVGTGQADSNGQFVVKLSAVLPDGPHTLTATARVPGYHSDSPLSSDTVTVTIDTNPPVASAPDMIEDIATGGIDLNDNITSDPSPTFQGTMEPGSDWVLYVDGVQEHAGFSADGTWEWTINPKAEGTHQVGIKAIDAAGNESAVASLSVLLDLTPPVSSHSVNGLQVSLSATDTGGSGLYRIRYQVNGGSRHTYAGPFTIVQGDRVEYWAEDVAGNQEDPPHVYQSPIPGDVDGDGHVDVVDLLYFVDAFGSVIGDANYDPRCDFNDDGSVDVVDLLDLAYNFGK